MLSLSEGKNIAEFRKRKLPNDFSDVQSLKRFKNSGQEITPYPVIGRSVSDVEQKLSISKVVKCSTTGDGNCFFHEVFGDNSYGPYRAERAQDMRMEWHKFLSQFTSLDDHNMPDSLRSQLEKVFNMFLNKPGDLTG